MIVAVPLDELSPLERLFIRAGFRPALCAPLALQDPAFLWALDAAQAKLPELNYTDSPRAVLLVAGSDCYDQQTIQGRVLSSWFQFPLALA